MTPTLKKQEHNQSESTGKCNRYSIYARYGSTSNICPLCDAPPRDEGVHFGVDEPCQLWLDAISEYRSRKHTHVRQRVYRRPPTGGNQELVYDNFLA